MTVAGVSGCARGDRLRQVACLLQIRLVKIHRVCLFFLLVADRGDN